MRLAEKLKGRRTTPYKEIAEFVGGCPRYVGQIARGERVPKRKTGKAARVLAELEKRCREDESN